jgi:hypothetical protein
MSHAKPYGMQTINIASVALVAFAINMMITKILACGWFAAPIIHTVVFHVVSLVT